MLADAPATNVLGRDPDRALSLLHDPAAMRQWLRAKHIALWTFVGPPCAVVALVIGIARGQDMQGVAVALIVLSLPLGVLSIAAWIGIWLPYHPRGLLWRWRHRSDWRGAVSAVGNPRPLTFPRCAGDCGLAVDADPPHLDLAGSTATSAGRGTGGSVARYGSRLCRQLDRLRPGAGDYLKDRPPPPRQAQRIPVIRSMAEASARVRYRHWAKRLAAVGRGNACPGRGVKSPPKSEAARGIDQNAVGWIAPHRISWRFHKQRGWTPYGDSHRMGLQRRQRCRAGGPEATGAPGAGIVRSRTLRSSPGEQGKEAKDPAAEQYDRRPVLSAAPSGACSSG